VYAEGHVAWLQLMQRLRHRKAAAAA